jgi:hypothetical protein
MPHPVIVAADTLQIVPGDTATTPVTIIVTDQVGRIMPERVVSVSLSDPALGFLEYVNTSLGDTTNEFGRVELLFVCQNRVGVNTICAVCEGISAEPHMIVILARG